MIKSIIRYIYYDISSKLFRGKALPCRNVVMELTYRCNLSCRMCSLMNEIAKKENTTKESELEKEEIKQIITQLPSSSNITFTGGEVFLKKGFDEILQTASKRHTVTVASNGMLLEQYAELIVHSGVQAIGISLDGPPEIHDHVRNRKGLFDKLEKGLDSLTRAKLRENSESPAINLNAVILEENHTDLPEVVKLAKRLGADSCTFQIYDPSLSRSGISLDDNINYNENPLSGVQKIDPDSLKRTLKSILEEKEKNGAAVRFLPPLTVDEIVLFYQGKFDRNGWSCSFPWNTLRISPYGDVYPCLNYYIGNLRKNKLRELWNNDRYVQFRRMLKRRVLFKACIGCCKMVPKITI